MRRCPRFLAAQSIASSGCLSSSPGGFGPRCRADHSRVKRPIVNAEEPRMDTKTDGDPRTPSGIHMRLRFRPPGVTMSRDDGPLGARASRPHKAWHSLNHLPHLDHPGTAPWLTFGLAYTVPPDRMAVCSIAGKLSGGQRGSMRAGRPRSQGLPFRVFSSPLASLRGFISCRLNRSLTPLVGIFSPLPIFGEAVLSHLQPLSGPSSSFVALRG